MNLVLNIIKVLFVFLLTSFVYANDQFSPFDAPLFKHTLLLSRNVPSEVKSSMSLTKISSAIKKANLKKRPVIMAAKNGIFSLQQTFDQTFVMAKANILFELIKATDDFSKIIRAGFKRIKIETPEQIQFLIAPVNNERFIMESLTSYNSFDDEIETPYRPFYSKDKYSVYQIMKSFDESFTSVDGFITTNIWKGLGTLFKYHKKRKTEDPFMVMAKMVIYLDPDPALSSVSVRAVIGMPTEKELPFEEENDQIKFKKIIFPSTANGFGYMGHHIAGRYPVAFIQFKHYIEKSKPEDLYIRFGPIGSYKDQEWKRPTHNKYRKQVMRLRGEKGLAVVDFNIYNIVFDINKLQVKDIDIFYSIGMKGLPAIQFGRINKDEINTQFKDEINNTIQAALIEKQKEVKDFVTKTTNKFDSALMSKVIDKIFSTSDKKLLEKVK